MEADAMVRSGPLQARAKRKVLQLVCNLSHSGNYFVNEIELYFVTTLINTNIKPNPNNYPPIR